MVGVSVLGQDEAKTKNLSLEEVATQQLIHSQEQGAWHRRSWGRDNKDMKSVIWVMTAEGWWPMKGEGTTGESEQVRLGAMGGICARQSTLSVFSFLLPFLPFFLLPFFPLY